MHASMRAFGGREKQNKKAKKEHEACCGKSQYHLSKKGKKVNKKNGGTEVFFFFFLRRCRGNAQAGPDLALTVASSSTSEIASKKENKLGVFSVHSVNFASERPWSSCIPKSFHAGSAK